MKLSLITINFNNYIGLENTIKSVITQSFKYFEYIIIDGGSIDGSLETIKHYSDKISYWISEKDNGIYHAMNKGISKATGEYLMFLNSGDCLVDSLTLESCVQNLLKLNRVDFFYGNILVTNDKLNPQIWLKNYPDKLNLDFFKEDTINHQACFIRANVFKEIGLYPEYYRLASDYWFFLKALLLNKNFIHFDFPIVKYDLGGITGLNYQAYINEKNAVWQELVPASVKDLIEERDKLKNLFNYTLIRYGVLLNDHYQALKKKYLNKFKAFKNAKLRP